LVNFKNSYYSKKVCNLETLKTMTNILDLQNIGNQIAVSAKSLQEKCKTNGEIYISAKSLVGKIPTLKVLGDMVIFRMYCYNDNFRIRTLTIYRDADIVGIYSPDLQLKTDFECVEFDAKIGGHSTLKHKSGLILKCDISINDNHILEIAKGVETIGDGIPEYTILGDLPKPEIPLHSPKLPENEEIKVVEILTDKSKYGSSLVNVKFGNTEINRVIANAQLESMCSQYTLPFSFKIVGKRFKKDKSGKYLNSENEVVKNPSDAAKIVDLIDCQLPDFSDL
jgi:hypothetical protein